MWWSLAVQNYKPILYGLVLFIIFGCYLYVKNLQVTIKEQLITIERITMEKNKLLYDSKEQKKQFEELSNKLILSQQQTKTKIIKLKETIVSPDCDESIKYLKQESNNIKWD